VIAGYVPQEIFIFDDSLRRNIALGVPDKEIDDERVWHALRLVVLDSFTNSLPNGLDTLLGERGNALSGGQRQRVAIARALYAGPSFLIMDEATSALDPETEHALAETVVGLRAHTSILIIAHRLSTVTTCDRLVMLTTGRIADQGSFEELRERNAQFRQMVELAARHSGDQPMAQEQDRQTVLF
jgi:ATP-binding cassette subfamily C protein